MAGHAAQFKTASKIVCLGRTFPKHAKELGNPVPQTPIFFLKSPSAVIGAGEAILCPPDSDEVHHEAEVAVWIGASLTHATEDQAKAAMSGWTVLNDVTARDIQRQEKGRFSRAKNFDTFCPLSSETVHDLSWRHCRIQCLLNGTLRQNGLLTDLSLEPWDFIRYVSTQMTLRPGDLVSLGTPPGVGTMKPGDMVEVRLVDGRGRTLVSLTNPVA